MKTKRFSLNGKKYNYKDYLKLMTSGRKKKPDPMKDAVEVMKKKLESN